MEAYIDPVRYEKLQKIRALGIDPYPAHSHVTDGSVDLVHQFCMDEGAESPPCGKVAGRIQFIRRFGKAAFIKIQDEQGALQLYVRADGVGEQAFALFQLLDLGDFVGAEGQMFRTKAGEPSLAVETLHLLSKALHPMPEKFHGLQDVELRYRQRYVDLFVTEGVKHTFLMRSKAVQFMREWLSQRDFYEVETPVLQSIAGGANARPFVTHHNTLGRDLYLRIAPELFLKRLIVGGMARVYEINKCFRNEGVDSTHNPEFTTLELYLAYSDMEGMMQIFQDLLLDLTVFVKGSSCFDYMGHSLDFGNWRKLRYVDALTEYAGFPVPADPTRAQAVALLESAQVTVPAQDLGPWALLHRLFEEKVEPHLQEPTIVYAYPTEISPLSKQYPDQPQFTERFEAYCMQRELCNAFSELNDPMVQAKRFEEQAQRKAAGDLEAMSIDEDFLHALSYGMPPTGGIGIGVDRLMMLYANTDSIRDVLLFPAMKPKTL